MEEVFLVAPIYRKDLRCVDTGLPGEKLGCTKKSYHQAHSKIYKVMNCSGITCDL